MFEIAKFLWHLASAAAAVVVIIVSGIMLWVIWQALGNKEI